MPLLRHPLPGVECDGRAFVAVAIPLSGGKFSSWLVAVGAEGPFGVAPEDSRGAQPSTHSIWGIARCEWERVEHNDDTANQHTTANSGDSVLPRSPWGYIQYRMLEVDVLDQSTPVPQAACPGPFDAAVSLAFLWEVGDQLLRRSRMTVRTWIREVAETSPLIMLFPLLAITTFSDVALPHIFRSVRLGLRVNQRLLVPGHPSASVLASLRRQAGVRRTQAGRGEVADKSTKRSYEDVLLELPRKRARTERAQQRNAPAGPNAPRTETDPMKIIKAVFLSPLDKCTCF